MLIMDFFAKISTQFGKIQAFFLIFTILNIMLMPMLHEHDLPCCEKICEIDTESHLPDEHSDDKADECSVCKFINKHTVVSLDFHFHIDFYPPETNDYCILAYQDIIDFPTHASNKDPPTC
jgi:hypothetical protein